MIPKLKSRLLVLFISSIMSVFTIVFFLLAQENIKIRQNDELSLTSRQASLITLLLENASDYASLLRAWEKDYDLYFLLTDADGTTLYESTSPNSERVISEFLSEFNHSESSENIINENYSSQSGTHIFRSATGNEYYGIMCTIYTNDANMTLAIVKERQGLDAFSHLIVHYIIIWALVFAIIFAASAFLIKQALKPTELAMQSQKDFIAAVSHELKAPLAVILSGAEVIENLPDCTDNIRKHMNDIDQEISRMTRLISDLLLLSSVDAGNWTLHKSEVNLDTLLIKLYEKYETVSREKNIDLQLNMPEDCFPTIISDEDRLCQILEIFLDNAFTYSPVHSTIILDSRMDNNKITISIIDHGIGISENEKKRIFDRFYQCDKSHTKKDHFGLGLSIAKELSEKMNTQIHLSDTEGGGCTFALTLNTIDARPR